MSNSADPTTTVCPLCKGTKKIKEGHVTCPKCKGTGKVPTETKSQDIPVTISRRKNPVSNIQTRSFNLSDVQMRMDDDGNGCHFTGYASTTDVPYHCVDWMGEYDETIRAGAFTKTLRENRNVPLLFNHGGMPIASTRGGTMKLTEDSKGLRVEADLDRRQTLTNDLCIAVERQDLNSMSFSFEGTKDTWASASQRSVDELKLYDASIVTYPANLDTSASLRAEMQAAITPADNVRLHAAMNVVQQIREGKAISAANLELLQTALDALHQADDKLSQVEPILVEVNTALDDGQKAIAETIGTTDPDGDPSDTGFEAKSDKTDTPNVKGAAQGLANGGGNAAGTSDLNPPDGAGPRSQTPVASKRKKLTPVSVLETRAMRKALEELS